MSTFSNWLISPFWWCWNPRRSCVPTQSPLPAVLRLLLYCFPLEEIIFDLGKSPFPSDSPRGTRCFFKVQDPRDPLPSCSLSRASLTILEWRPGLSMASLTILKWRLGQKTEDLLWTARSPLSHFPFTTQSTGPSSALPDLTDFPLARVTSALVAAEAAVPVAALCAMVTVNDGPAH